MLGTLLEEYLAALLRRGRSFGTLKSYGWALDDLIRYLVEQGVEEPQGVRGALLESWLDRMAARGTMASTRALASVAARGWIRWGRRYEKGFPPGLEDYLPVVRTPRGLPRPIPPEDLARIKAALAPSRGPRASVAYLRTRALFFTLLSTGARVSEVLRMTRHEVQRAIVWQKGGTEKVLILPPKAIAAVEDYLQARKDDCPWLWVTHEPGDELGPRQLNPSAVRDIWRELCRQLQVKRFTTHQIRHTTATELLEAGVPEIVIAEHLGHHGLATIRNYAAVRASQRQIAVDAMERLLEGPPAAPALRLLPKSPKGGRPRYG